MTGQENASQLTLNGDPDDVGTYQCRYVDNYGDERRKTFVIISASINQTNRMTIIISVTIVIAILFIAAGLWWFFRNSVCN